MGEGGSSNLLIQADAMLASTVYSGHMLCTGFRRRGEGIAGRFDRFIVLFEQSRIEMHEGKRCVNGTLFGWLVIDQAPALSNGANDERHTDHRTAAVLAGSHPGC
jgi:hypothetical protein